MIRSRLIILHKLLFLSFLLISTSLIEASNRGEHRILVLGDSISAGYGLPSGAGWVHLLDQYLTKEKYSFTILNASISGDTSAGGKSRITNLVNQFKPTIVILELGANDALRGFPLKSSYQNLYEIITICKSNQAKVLILGMKIPSNYGADYTSQFSNMYLDLSKNTQVLLVPFFLEGVATKRQYFQEDGIHPNAEAQPILLKNMLPSLLKILK